MNEYEVKFAREAKDNPRDWVIVPNTGYGFRLVEIGGFEDPPKLIAGTDFTELEKRVAAHIDADRMFLRSMDYGMMP